jgi:hypothetical protein
MKIDVSVRLNSSIAYIQVVHRYCDFTTLYDYPNPNPRRQFVRDESCWKTDVLTGKTVEKYRC